MKQKVSLLAVCAVLLSLFGAGYLAVVLDPGRKAEEQLTAARKEDVFVLSPADTRSVLEQFAPELRFVERQTGVSIDELNSGPWPSSRPRPPGSSITAPIASAS